MKTYVVTTVGKEVACTLFPAHAVEPQRQASGFVTAAPRSNLIGLKVVYGYLPLNLVAGDTVYVPLEHANSPWGRRRLKLSETDVEFILVPVDQISVVGHPCE